MRVSFLQDTHTHTHTYTHSLSLSLSLPLFLVSHIPGNCESFFLRFSQFLREKFWRAFDTQIAHLQFLVLRSYGKKYPKILNFLTKFSLFLKKISLLSYPYYIRCSTYKLSLIFMLDYFRGSIVFAIINYKSVYIWHAKMCLTLTNNTE